jgi:uncharacterized protein (TIGR00106 family)
MVVAEVSIEPIGTSNPSFGNMVAKCVDALNQQPDIKFQVTATGTILEGERNRIFQAVNSMEEACFQAGAQRVITNIRIDERHDQPMKSIQQMEQEVDSQIGPSQQRMPFSS